MDDDSSGDFLTAEDDLENLTLGFVDELEPMETVLCPNTSEDKEIMKAKIEELKDLGFDELVQVPKKAKAFEVVTIL